MCPSHPLFHHPERRLLPGFLWFLLTILTGGCATTTRPPPAPREAPVAVTAPAPSELVPVVRYGRYTLVELAPTAAQQDLLLQVVDVTVADTLHANVGDALRHVLQRSGYQLCDGHDADALLAFPLPVAHYRLGPVVLRDALLTLGGPAWDLQVDDGARRVCFVRAVSPTRHPEKPSRPEPDDATIVETFPIATEGRP